MYAADRRQGDGLMANELPVEVRDVDMGFRTGAVMQQVLHKVSFTIRPGETLGLVGESGSGKSTMGRILVGLYQPTGGSVRLFGRSITDAGRRANLAAVRSRL